MAKYRVTIDGRIYEVMVEPMDDGESLNPVTGNSRPEATVNNQAPAPQPKAAASSGGAAKGTPVPAPLAGTILSVKVKPGDKIAEGDVIVTLEALKLENEIVAPLSGTVLEVINEGASVEAGQTLAVIG